MPPKSHFRDPTSETLLNAARQNSTPHKPTDFTQSDLLSLNVCKTVDQLLHPLNDLVRIGHFILLTSSSPSHSHASFLGARAPTYRLRPSHAVAALSSLSSDARRCYEIIESAGSAAIWSKTITMRTKMPQIVVTKSLKALEVAKLVKQMKNVKMPNRRMYLLAGLKPSEEATGGSWFSEGELDEGLVEGVAEKVVEYIESESWRVGPKKIAVAKEDKLGVGVAAPWDETQFYTAVNRRRYPLLPHPADYKDYPTASEARTYLDSLNIVQDKDITVTDMQALMDVLEWDGRIERMGFKKEAVDQDVEEDEESSSEDGSAGDASDGEGSDIEVPGAKRKRQAYGEASVPKKKFKHLNGNTQDFAQTNEDDVDQGTDNDNATDNENGTNAPASIVPTTEPKAKPVILTHDVPMYRSVRRPFGYDHNKGAGSAFAETPCSRCPVFDLCDDSGPINARDCGYLPGWLKGAQAL